MRSLQWYLLDQNLTVSCFSPKLIGHGRKRAPVAKLEEGQEGAEGARGFAGKAGEGWLRVEG